MMNTMIILSMKKYMPIVILALLLTGCERDIEDLKPASYPAIPEVFIDGFSAGLNYAAFGGSVPTAFDVDHEVTWNNSETSMRIEVPDANDPRGAYAGGVYFTEVGRDLSGYNVLTFWAKASRSASVDLVGFGNDLGESKYQVTISGLKLNSSWKKYYIPIPDPSRLTAERGMFMYSEGPENGEGYTFWIDEVKFEKLATIAHGKYAILNGLDITETSFTGITKALDGMSSVFNLPEGIDQKVDAAPAYFEFSSSDESIATVDESGNVTVVGGPGTAIITATMGGVKAAGSLTIQSLGIFSHAPVPSHAPGDVISLFSDTYSNVPVNYYNGYWAPYQTTLSADFTVNGDNVLYYINFNFVGIEFTSPTIDASAMTHLHADIYFPNTLNPGAQFKFQLVDAGADGVLGNADDAKHTLTFTSPTLVSQDWISFDIPLSNFTGLTSKGHLAQLIFEGTNIPGFYADNIYFHK
ncbi:MAG: carbohydrate binding domain-containing protein [Bacteroidales bacterium]